MRNTKKYFYGSKENDITSEKVYLNRRKILAMAGIGISSLVTPMALAGKVNTGQSELPSNATNSPKDPSLTETIKEKIQKGVKALPDAGKLINESDKVAPFEVASKYNNFYEFGTGKNDPSDKAASLTTDPWTIEVSGNCENPGKFALEDIVSEQQFEQRIYRLRCVEAWSMVIPWIGFPLKKLISFAKPLSSAKYVRFETLHRPSEMPGQRSFFRSIDYPYVEGLRMDEAENDLAFLALGMYDKIIPPQNGAPIRLVVPWKYGFKSIKSIVKIEFVSQTSKNHLGYLGSFGIRIFLPT